MIEAKIDIKPAVKMLNEFEKKLQKKIIKQAARAGLKPVLREVRASFPKRTGVAAKSFKVKVLKAKNGIGCRIATNPKALKEGFYGYFIDRGYTSRSGKHIEGKHILEQAAQKEFNQAVKTFEAKIVEAVINQNRQV